MPPAVSDHLVSFLTSLAIGLLIGIERERTGSSVGLRTTALVALFGSVAALVSQSAGIPFFLPIALLSVTWIVTIQPTEAGHSGGSGGGYTTRIAVVLCFSLGAMVWLGHGQYAVMVAIVSATLLHFKAQLRSLGKRISPQDLASILQFSALSFIVLPLLPKTGFGPYGAFNPHHVWIMVVLISGLSLTGYLAMRIVGNMGAPLLGVLGGLVSSTATTLAYARHAQRSPNLAPLSTFVILMANVIVPLRLGVITSTVSPQMMATLWPVLIGNFVAGGVAVFLLWREIGQGEQLPLPAVTNPTEIRAALTFGTMYAAILLLASWLSDLAGNRGLYLVSFISGLTELDAIVLSTLRLFETQKLEAVQAARAIGIAILSNLVFKTALLAWIAGHGFLRRCLPGMAGIGLGVGIGLWFVK